MFKSILVVAIGVPLVSFAKTEIRYSDKVPLRQQELLNSDLERLEKLTPEDSDGELKRVLKLGSVSAGAMDQWLSQRVHFVVEETYQTSAASFVIEKRNQKYPANDYITDSIYFDRSGESPRARVVMSNLGTGIYSMAKSNQVLLGVIISGIGVLTINSPRVGLLQVGEGLFQALAKDWSEDKVENELHSIWRLTTLFHEARHSDGNGESLGFKHVICPQGHNFFGKYACDNSANGAYRVSALVLRSYLRSCQSCTKQEKDIMGMMVADHMNRILVPVKRSNSVNDLCRLAESKGPKPRFCEDPDGINEWDDAPESVKL